MTFIAVTDWDMRVSGYTSIMAGLCGELSKHSKFIGLGVNYRREENNLPFVVVPVRWERMDQALKALEDFPASELEGIFVGLDVPKAIELAKQVERLKTPLYGIYPIEALPLCKAWAAELWRYSHSFVMSRFGTAELERHGLPVTYLDVVVDPSKRVPRTLEERQLIRQSFGFKPGKLIILTVAVNQERKYLPAGFDILSKLVKMGIDVHWLLVTTRSDRYGFVLDELAQERGVAEHFTTFERGLSHKTLLMLFGAADLYLTTSKAEGLAMPVLEAMSMRLPVVGPDHTAIREHLSEDRGFLVENEYEYVEAWGNSHRFIIDAERAATAIKHMYESGLDQQEVLERVDRAEAYVRARNWESTAAEVWKIVKPLKIEKQPDLPAHSAKITVLPHQLGSIQEMIRES